MKIGVAGLWHLGEIYSACLADMGHTVVGFGEEAVVAGLQENVPPLAEPGLVELLEKNQREGRLSYGADLSRVAECDVLWLTHDVPVDENDVADASVILETVRDVAAYLKSGVTIAVSSQLPVGTSEEIVGLVKDSRPDLAFSYFYSPENLRLGDAMRCFMEEKRFVVGADSDAAFETAKEIFAPLPAQLIRMSPASAEMTKHALNAWLATSIGFTNDLADVCEKVGADVEDVIKALKAEPRIGEKAYLFAGLGFAGWSIARDLKALMKVADEKGLELPIVSGAYSKNKSRGAIVLKRLEEMFGSVKGKKVALFGLSYKAGTPALNHSLSVWLDEGLTSAGAEVSIYDPLVTAEAAREVTHSAFSSDPYEAAIDADIVIVPVADFKLKDLDFERLAGVLREKNLFDAQNVLVAAESRIRDAGISYSSIGR